MSRPSGSAKQSSLKNLLNKETDLSSKTMIAIRSEVENSNRVIEDLQKLIQMNSTVITSEELKLLQDKLEAEKQILRETVQRVMMEQRKNQKTKWDPLPVNIKEDF
jgi:hypothetical protein